VATCSVLWPIALLVLTLIIIQYLLIRLRKENTIMETSNLKTKATMGVKAIAETGWAIGTSIAGTQVL